MTAPDPSNDFSDNDIPALPNENDEILKTKADDEDFTSFAVSATLTDQQVVDGNNTSTSNTKQISSDMKDVEGKEEEVVTDISSGEKNDDKPTTRTSSTENHSNDQNNNVKMNKNGTESGNGDSSPDNTNKKRYVTPQDFELLKVIGMGAFGKVLQVKNKSSQQILAMKVISKRLLNRKAAYVENIHAEREILTKIRHPFIVTMHCSFQTKEKLFIIMDFLAGGELFLRLGREGIFLEPVARFYIGEIILALEHLHSRGILHRDLKPENILLGVDGHLCLTDFGLAKDFRWDDDDTDREDGRALTVCGTQEYMAPEMVARKGYTKAADWWSLGCIAYEMLAGRPPFESRKGAKDLFNKIMKEKVKMPEGSSKEACVLLKGLLKRNATDRFGAAKGTMFQVGGVSQVKNLDFFKGLDWRLLEMKEIDPPMTAKVDNEHDLRHFYDEFTKMSLPRSVKEMSDEDFQPKRCKSDAFRGFSFIQHDFPLPDRTEEQDEKYWNSIEEDGESLSEAASSMNAHDDDTIVTQQSSQMIPTLQPTPENAALPGNKKRKKKKKKKDKGQAQVQKTATNGPTAVKEVSTTTEADATSNSNDKTAVRVETKTTKVTELPPVVSNENSMHPNTTKKEVTEDTKIVQPQTRPSSPPKSQPPPPKVEKWETVSKPKKQQKSPTGQGAWTTTTSTRTTQTSRPLQSAPPPQATKWETVSMPKRPQVQTQAHLRSQAPPASFPGQWAKATPRVQKTTPVPSSQYPKYASAPSSDWRNHKMQGTGRVVKNKPPSLSSAEAFPSLGGFPSLGSGGTPKVSKNKAPSPQIDWSKIKR